MCIDNVFQGLKGIMSADQTQININSNDFIDNKSNSWIICK